MVAVVVEMTIASATVVLLAVGMFVVAAAVSLMSIGAVVVAVVTVSLMMMARRWLIEVLPVPVQ